MKTWETQLYNLDGTLLWLDRENLKADPMLGGAGDIKSRLRHAHANPNAAIQPSLKSKINGQWHYRFVCPPYIFDLTFPDGEPFMVKRTLLDKRNSRITNMPHSQLHSNVRLAQKKVERLRRLINRGSSHA